MDILAIKPQTVAVEIKHPATGERIGLTVDCVSLEDDRVKVVERRIRNRALSSGRNKMTAEKVEDNTIELLTAVIVGWSWEKGLKLGDLENPPLTNENVKTLLSVNWIAKQIDLAIGDEAAFFKE